MRRILLVARREFLSIARTRSFWLTLFILPLMFMVMPVLSRFMAPEMSSSYIMVDASGRYGPLVERRIELNNQRDVLYDFARYARRWDLKSARPDAVWDDGERPFSDEEVKAFTAAGGVSGALAESPPPADTPKFDRPQPDYPRALLPADVPAGAGPEAFGKAVGHYMGAAKDRPKGMKPVAAAIYIPENFGAPGVPVRIWTSNSGSFSLVDLVRRELSGAVRTDAAKAAGLDDATAAKVQSAVAPIQVSAPPRGQGRDRLMLQSALPLGISYFLLMSVFISGAWLLQGVLEERSNKLLEAVLACISPAEMMYGKLLGVVGIGFSVMIVWLSFLGIGVFALPSGIGEVVKPALASLNSPWLAVALLFYFICGYLICAMMYLAVGAVSESMSDAQAYLTPISLLLFLPFFVLSQLISNPDAIAAKVLSWIPIYTPFAMMARMGAGVELYEVIGTGVLLIAFVALEFYLLGRVFQNSLLRTGQPPKLVEFAKLMFKPAAK